ncbi:aspartate carbamoyltransferase [Spirochaeta isovalerica]|uniref:Aspartate carbamoyltransferase n=1 Tax=Spirochaeta isovalerica TaxID=150 RepID=A0A841R775_9SPIO|nr:aspartate carbamoyltransferase [Spirochaeta isovalerica]MBB6479057.1 aspartate carbamoyltransferase [Spirochaeta isovalerica]
MPKKEGKSHFYGRTISVVDDLSVDEQLYLYRKTAELKQLIREGGDTSDFRIDDPELGVYLMFFENSTRTKESFRNAAAFHNVKLNNFDAQTSSFNKSESIGDTIKMLFGYSNRSVFIMRTAQEGVCSMLDELLGEYAKKIGYDKPAFLNGGDGKHEHPTQEFLDEYTFLEKKGWDNSEIHIALTGDLFHGRTVHSKVDGLKVFKKVKVDLIAPEDLSLPEHYEQRMIDNNYEVRRFDSIDDYFEQSSVADIWYFTRLQLERMGDEVKEKAKYLRAAVTFREEFMSKLPEGTKFYHPLPRHKVYPVIPGFLDRTPLNGWDEQSMNGYFTRIIEIGMVAGKIGNDFEGTAKSFAKIKKEFIEEIPVTRKSKVQDRYKVGIKPVEEGIVIDHIGRGEELDHIWNLIDRIRRILSLNCRSSHGVFHTSDPDDFKGIISLPDVLSFDEKELKKLAAIAPGCTLNIIENSSVKKKYRLHMPPRIYNFDEISCKNENCISHPSEHENIATDFYRSSETTFICRFCDTSHKYHEIWDI